MLGHKWERAQATVIEVNAVPPSRSGMTSHLEHSYVVEVQRRNGEVLRGTVTQRSLLPHPVGSLIPVEANAKSGEIRIDPEYKAESTKDMIRAARQMRAEMGQAMGAPGAASLGVAAARLAAMDTAFGGAGSPGPGIAGSVHITGPGGQDIAAAGVSADEVTGLAQAMMSGDPAARQAAAERLQQIKEQVSHQAGVPHGTAGATSPRSPATPSPQSPDTPSPRSPDTPSPLSPVHPGRSARPGRSVRSALDSARAAPSSNWPGSGSCSTRES